MNANKHSMSDYAFVNDSDYEDQNEMEIDSEDADDEAGAALKRETQELINTISLLKTKKEQLEESKDSLDKDFYKTNIAEQIFDRRKQNYAEKLDHDIPK